MKRWCNKKWETVDNPTTILLEIIFQVCVQGMVVDSNDPDADSKKRLQGTYAEFLGLPFDIRAHNGLTFVVAHKHHGAQMRTGWPSDPTTLQERLDGDANNNILIETRTSNYLKNQFAESWYPILQRAVADIRMPLEYANEDLPMGPYNAWFERMDLQLLDDDDDEEDQDVGDEYEEDIDAEING
ncbi:hypothetical protein HYQ45_006837 [Verticillium longisporum]|nr:hypothetical protein HYQ44_009457 [Verticillium longisporum]KAG7135391.1 hypothetical protein HYQ45_006837 [Verticillium longisporum]